MGDGTSFHIDGQVATIADLTSGILNPYRKNESKKVGSVNGDSIYFDLGIGFKILFTRAATLFIKVHLFSLDIDKVTYWKYSSQYGAGSVQSKSGDGEVVTVATGVQMDADLYLNTFEITTLMIKHDGKIHHVKIFGTGNSEISVITETL